MHFLLMSWRIEAVTLNVLIDPASQFYNQHKNNRSAAASMFTLGQRYGRDTLEQTEL